MIILSDILSVTTEQHHGNKKIKEAATTLTSTETISAATHNQTNQSIKQANKQSNKQTSNQHASKQAKAKHAKQTQQSTPRNATPVS
jgi:hypothetical protein